MSEEQIKQQQGNQIAEILSSIKNCNDCPIRKTCDNFECIMNDNLCSSMRDKDGLNITD